MCSSVYSRDVEEQLAEALPVLGQAALRHALGGLNQLLDVTNNATHQKLLIWLWSEGYCRFGSAAFGQDGPGLRVWLPGDGGDLAVAVGGSEIRVDVDPLGRHQGRYTMTTSVIESNARAAATNLLSHLEETEAKRTRRRDAQARTDDA